MKTLKINNDVVRASIDVSVEDHSRSKDSFIYIDTHWEDGIPMTKQETLELINILREAVENV